jgi:hypothetical protein
MIAKSLERLVDEMAVALCNVAELGCDDACSMALLAEGFRAADIAEHLDEARTLARLARAGEIDFWYARQWDRD